VSVRVESTEASGAGPLAAAAPTLHLIAVGIRPVERGVTQPKAIVTRRTRTSALAGVAEAPRPPAVGIATPSPAGIDAIRFVPRCTAFRELLNLRLIPADVPGGRGWRIWNRRGRRRRAATGERRADGRDQFRDDDRSVVIAAQGGAVARPGASVARRRSPTRRSRNPSLSQSPEQGGWATALARQRICDDADQNSGRGRDRCHRMPSPRAHPCGFGAGRRRWAATRRARRGRLCGARSSPPTRWRGAAPARLFNPNTVAGGAAGGALQLCHCWQSRRRRATRTAMPRYRF
jgi:hypothetical protein